MKNKNGSITVFLSLILLIIMSLVCITIEGARINTIKSFIDRGLLASMDSILAEFHGPLLEDYHVFALDKTYGTGDESGHKIQYQLESYINHNFYTEQTKFNLGKNVDILDLSLDGVNVKNEISLVDYEGDLFINQAVDHMKYKSVGDSVEFILENLSLMEDVQKASKMYGEKIKVEKELVEIDRSILKLMNVLDGISTHENGLNFSKYGGIKTNKNFIKKIGIKPATRENMGVNSNEIFQATNQNYTNLDQNFVSIEESFKNIEKSNNLIKEYEKEKNKKKEKVVGEDKKFEIEDIEAQDKEIDKKIEKEKATIAKETEKIHKENKEMRVLMKEVQDLTPKAIGALVNLKKNKKKSGSLLSSYRFSLYKNQEDLGEYFDCLQDDLQDMEQYCNTDLKKTCNYQQVIGILQKNKVVLGQVIQKMDRGRRQVNLGEFVRGRKLFVDARKSMKDYNLQDISIDYSQMDLSREIISSSDLVRDIIKAGVLPLVSDVEAISDLEILGKDLPSNMIKKNSDTMGFDALSILEDIEGGREVELDKVFEEFGQWSKLNFTEESSIDEIMKHVLFLEYIREYFQDFEDLNGKTSLNDGRALDYELEYILCNNLNDKDNFTDIVSVLLTIRTIMNFFAILLDRVKTDKAEVVATTVIGFTGLPALVKLVKVVILFIWAISEALVEVSALVSGKKVPLAKSGKNFVMSFEDIFIINKELIDEKTKLVKEGPMGLSYDNYLYLFLFFTKKDVLSYCAMDLIQENIKRRYDPEFKIKNCIFGFKTDVDFYISPKFSIMGRLDSKKSEKIYQHKRSMAYSY